MLPVLLLTACHGWEGSEEEGLVVFRREARAGADGRFVAQVDVVDGERAFLLTAVHRPDALLHVATVESPAGEVVYRATDWWSSSRNKTNAGYAADVVTLNWPVGPDDDPLTPGRWRVELRTDSVDPFDVSVALKSDADLRSGLLVVELIFTGNLDADAGLRAGLDEALTYWRDVIYGPMGIDIQVLERTWAGPARLASPGFGDRERYLDAVGDKALRVVPIMIVRGITDGAEIFGAAGGIPGALEGTDRSAVTVSALLARGADLEFQREEVQLLAETMAHEVGHYLGLFHPAELPLTLDDDAVPSWDALDDTPECDRFGAECVPALADNLMFPTPVCALEPGPACTSFVRQIQLTPTQQAVMHGYVGVD